MTFKRKSLKISHVKTEYLIYNFDLNTQEISSSMTIEEVEVYNCKAFRHLVSITKESGIKKDVALDIKI